MSKETIPQGPIERLHDVMPDDGMKIVDELARAFFGLVEVDEEEVA